MELIVAVLLSLQIGAECDCSRPVWSARCDVAGNCEGSSPSSGCAKCQSGCTDCGAGFLMIGVPPQLPDGSYDPQIAFWGSVNKDGTMTISEPGPLAKYDITKGKVLERINGWAVRKHRLHNLTGRKNAAMLMKFKGMKAFWARL